MATGDSVYNYSQELSDENIHPTSFARYSLILKPNQQFEYIVQSFIDMKVDEYSFGDWRSTWTQITGTYAMEDENSVTFKATSKRESIHSCAWKSGEREIQNDPNLSAKIDHDTLKLTVFGSTLMMKKGNNQIAMKGIVVPDYTLG
jgi:hypothetical protein